MGRFPGRVCSRGPNPSRPPARWSRRAVMAWSGGPMAQRRTRGKREKKAPIATQSPVSAVDFAHPGFTLDNGEIERGLITGEHAGALKDYFGEANYQELHDLARE